MPKDNNSLDEIKDEFGFDSGEKETTELIDTEAMLSDTENIDEAALEAVTEDKVEENSESSDAPEKQEMSEADEFIFSANNSDENVIGEFGDEEQVANEDKTNATNADEIEIEAIKGSKVKPGKKKIIIAVSVVIVVMFISASLFIGANTDGADGVDIFSEESDSVIEIQSSYIPESPFSSNKSDVINNNDFQAGEKTQVSEKIDSLVTGENFIANNTSIENDSSYQDKVFIDTSIMKPSYVSEHDFENFRNSIAGTTQSELDVFLILSKQNHDAIQALQNAGGGLLKLDEKNKELVAQLSAQNKELKALRATVDVLKKNQGWNHNRLKKLETGKVGKIIRATKNKSIVKVKSQPKAKLKEKHKAAPAPRNQISEYGIRGISEVSAFIYHKETSERSHVQLGSHVKGYGAVTSIDAKNVRIYTTGGFIQ